MLKDSLDIELLIIVTNIIIKIIIITTTIITAIFLEILLLIISISHRPHPMFLGEPAGASFCQPKICCQAGQTLLKTCSPEVVKIVMMMMTMMKVIMMMMMTYLESEPLFGRIVVARECLRGRAFPCILSYEDRNHYTHNGVFPIYYNISVLNVVY